MAPRDLARTRRRPLESRKLAGPAVTAERGSVRLSNANCVGRRRTDFGEARQSRAKACGFALGLVFAQAKEANGFFADRMALALTDGGVDAVERMPGTFHHQQIERGP